MKALIEWSGFTCMRTNRKPQQGAPASGEDLHVLKCKIEKYSHL